MGVAGAAMSAGQLVVIPLATWLTLTIGWRQSYLWLGLGLVVLILPLAATLLRNDPRDHGLEPYGATPAVRAAGAGFTEMGAAQALGVMGATSIFGSIASGWIEGSGLPSSAPYFCRK